MTDAPAGAVALAALGTMPEFLAASFAPLSTADQARRGHDGELSPVEQCWHLADLEREGFGQRIARLRAEERPFLPDFEGARLVEERRYRELSLAEGLRAFAEARQANLALLASLRPEEWTRSGTQEGVGEVALCDLPRLMAAHDAAHRAEIERWLES